MQKNKSEENKANLKLKQQVKINTVILVLAAVMAIVAGLALAFLK